MKKIILPYSKVRAELNGSPMSSGSCPFSTVQVTLKIGDTGSVFVAIPFISITGADFTVDGLTSGLLIRSNSEVVLTAILYEGKLEISENRFVVNSEESTGEYEENVEDGYITITGECSITLVSILT